MGMVTKTKLEMYIVFVDRFSVELIKRNIANKRKKENDNLYANIMHAHSPDVFIYLFV